ncbi:MAG: tetratricopeptide repeat protein, partial [Chloroflexi bacterium]|nr:tetratricopeptide repeat protein [Chloroflexota bacterium]
MQTAPVELREPFTERVERLADELTLAIKWNRPSILLAVFQSGYVATNALIALEARLRELGHKIVQFAVDDKDNADIPARLSEYPNREMTVFFVSGLQFGGEAALRALNIRREYFVENRLRVVFWLTEKEAIAVPKYAPDFWAFRHRVVEFVEPPTPEQAVPLARQLAWEGLDDRTAREDTDAKIALRLALLHDLPEGDGTLAARAELQFTLAGLYLAKREFDESIRYWNEAITIAERLDNTQFLAWCYNGLGNVNHGLTRYDDAIAAYQRAIELDPKNAHPHNGVGNVYYALARYDDAIAAYQGAIALDPKFAYPHNGLGAMYRDLARYDDAIAAYQRATELDPNLAYAYGNL